MFRSVIAAVLTAAGLAFPSADARSTTVLPMNLEELARRSDTAVLGKVKSVSYGVHPTHGYAETRTTFTVDRTVYGRKAAQEVVVCVPGGPAGDGFVTVVPGMPRFKEEEKAVLFLVLDDGRGVGVPTGAEQGVFRVRKDPLTKKEYLFNQSVDLNLSLQSPNTSAPPSTQAGGKPRAGVTVEDLKQTLDSLAPTKERASGSKENSGTAKRKTKE